MDDHCFNVLDIDVMGSFHLFLLLFNLNLNELHDLLWVIEELTDLSDTKLTHLQSANSSKS